MIHLAVSTDQEAFDAVVTHLATMTQPSKADDAGRFQCVYFGPEGRRCAVGALMPADAEEYLRKRRLLSWCLSDLIYDGHVDVQQVSLNLLITLQLYHDDDAEWDDRGFIGWRGLAQLAEARGLDTTVLDAVSAQRA